jgi:hypothetical protein
MITTRGHRADLIHLTGSPSLMMGVSRAGRAVPTMPMKARMAVDGTGAFQQADQEEQLAQPQREGGGGEYVNVGGPAEGGAMGQREQDGGPQRRHHSSMGVICACRPSW